jgi:hypothetical protein
MDHNLRMRKLFSAHHAVIKSAIRCTAGRLAPKWMQMGVFLVELPF